MDLVEFQYEPVSLDVNKFCFDEEHHIPDTGEKSRKNQSITEWCSRGGKGVMDTNTECLSFSKVEVMEYFQLSDMRYNDRNAVTKRVSTTVLQLYLI